MEPGPTGSGGAGLGEMVTTQIKNRWKPYPAYKPSGIEWLGEIPEGWQSERAKWVASLKYGDSLPSDSREEGEIDVWGSNGPVGLHNRSNTLAPTIIIGRKGSYGKVTYSDKPCFAIDTTYFVDPSATETHIRWLYYTLLILRLDDFSEDSAVPGLSREYVYSRILPLPPLPEQQAIASFLDRETAKIDELITKRQKLIELLEEKRTAVISHAVTKGLDPNVKTKPSGIPWLSEIPKHWEVVPIKRITANKPDSIVDGPFGSSINVSQDYIDEGVPVIRTINIDDRGFKEENLRFISEDKFRTLRRHGVNPGDVLLSKVGTIGNCCIFPKHLKKGMLSTTGSCRISVDKKKVTPEYLYRTLCSMKEHFLLLASANVQPFLNMQTIKAVVIPLPPLEEQHKIIENIKLKETQIDTLIAKVREGIEKLTEYRTALISAAVTGKIDVREAV